jgi:putative flippase GtrA
MLSTTNIHRFLRFCVVGGVGFLVDAGMLELLVSMGIDTLAARILSIIVALHVTYVLHTHYTFNAARTWRNWRGFLLSNSIGATVNYGTFFLLLLALEGSTPVLQRQIAILGGTAIALVLNYWMNRRFVFGGTA